VRSARLLVPRVVAAGCVTAAVLAVAPLAGAESPAGRGHQASTTPTTVAPAAPVTATTVPAAPVIPVPPPPPGPGGSVAWRPEGRSAVNRPLVYRGNVNGVEVAWLDPQLTRPVFVPGTGDPGGPWSWGGQIAPEVRGQLVAAFNGGFKMGDIAGGWYADGRVLKDLVPGQASLVIYNDGHAVVGEWGRDVTLTPDVVAVRQNLGLLVDGGGPVAAAGSSGAWGGSVAGVATARSGAGIDANGAIVLAQARVSPQGLAEALAAAGAGNAARHQPRLDHLHPLRPEPRRVGLGWAGHGIRRSRRPLPVAVRPRLLRRAARAAHRGRWRGHPRHASRRRDCQDQGCEVVAPQARHARPGSRP